MRVSTLVVISTAFLLSACATTISRDFVPTFGKANTSSEDLFSHLVVSLNYDRRHGNFIVGRESGEVEVWNSHRAVIRTRFQAHEDRVNNLTLVQEGEFLLTDSQIHSETKLWDTASGKLLMSISGASGLSGATPDPNLYIVTYSSAFRLLDFRAKRVLPDEYPCTGVPTALTTDIGSGQIAIGTASGTIAVWRFVTTAGRPSPSLVSSQQPYAVGDWVVGLQFSRDGTTLYVVTRSGLVDEYDSLSLVKKQSLQTSLKFVYSAEFIESKKILALGGTKEELELNDPWLEVISLSNGRSQLFPSNSYLAVLKYVPPLSSVLAIQHGAPTVIPLP